MEKMLRIAVFVAGLAICVIGVQPALTGVLGFGINPDPDFITVNFTEQFAIQNNHMRYLGGVFFLAGIVCLIGAFRLREMRQTLIIICLLIAGAAAFRFFGRDVSPFTSALLPSLLAEIIIAPILAIWLWRSGQGET